MTTTAPALDLRHGTQRVFAHLLASTLTVSVVNFTVWFAVTFWVFIETRSIMATGIIAGIFLAATSLTGIPFGGIVDRFGKKAVMQASAAVSATIYLGCLGGYLLVPAEVFRDPASPVLWAFVVALMLGVIAGNLRTIALPTLVTLLVPAPVRDRANGLVGTATGVSFLVTSVLSGLLVAFDGMRSVLVIGVVALSASLVHLARIRVPSAPAAPPSADGGGRGIDLRGTLRVVRSVPGLPALIVFTCVNNLLGGVFMALMDPYGLSMVSVQTWGLLWGALSTLVIIGGLLVARTGLGSRPVRTLLLVNAVLWTSTMLFPLQASMVTLTAGMAVFMLLMPYAEAAEQTVLQRVVPYHRQGRVFGFAQSVEQAASPLTAFLLAPVTELVVVPFMTDGAGARTLGPWFGTGADRAIALVFVVTGLLGLVLTLAALASGPYRRLSTAYLTAPDAEPAPHAGHAPAPAPGARPADDDPTEPVSATGAALAGRAASTVADLVADAGQPLPGPVPGGCVPATAA